MGKFSIPCFFVFSLLLSVAVCKTVKRDVKALNEIKASLGWRVVYAWVGDDPCGDGDLPPWSGVTCSQQGDYRVVTELEVYAVSIVGPFPTAVTNLLDLTRLDLHNNKLTGPIPPQIGRLKHLKLLRASCRLHVWQFRHHVGDHLREFAKKHVKAGRSAF